MAGTGPSDGGEQGREGRAERAGAGALPLPSKTLPPPQQHLIITGLLEGEETQGGDHGPETGKGWGWGLNSGLTDSDTCALPLWQAPQLESGREQGRPPVLTQQQ